MFDRRGSLSQHLKQSSATGVAFVRLMQLQGGSGSLVPSSALLEPGAGHSRKVGIAIITAGHEWHLAGIARPASSRKKLTTVTPLGKHLITRRGRCGGVRWWR